MPVLCRELDVALAVPEAGTVEDLFLEEVSVGLVPLPAINAGVQTTLHETVSEILTRLADYIKLTPCFRPGSGDEMLCLR